MGPRFLDMLAYLDKFVAVDMTVGQVAVHVWGRKSKVTKSNVQAV